MTDKTPTHHILQISDFHLLADSGKRMMGIDTQQTLLAVIDQAWSDLKQIDFMLLTGDLVQDPLPETYQRLKSCLEPLPVPCYCLPGNHDETVLINQSLANSNIIFQPQIILDGWQIICLDSTVANDPGGFLSPDQIQVLEQTLKEQPELHALVTLHHSPVLTGAEWLDTMILSNHAEFFHLLSRYPQVKGVVFGHIHQALDTVVNGLRLLGCPSTCFQFKPDSKDFALDYVPQGYRWIELCPDGSISTEVVRLARVPEGLDVSSGGY